MVVKSYSHGDTAALINIANELGIVDLINKHIPKDQKQIRDNCTVGASLLLAAIGRSCHPTSKNAWYDWCKETSLEDTLFFDTTNFFTFIVSENDRCDLPLKSLIDEANKIQYLLN